MGTTCFDVDDLCFPFAFLDLIFPEVHSYIDICTNAVAQKAHARPQKVTKSETQRQNYPQADEQTQTVRKHTITQPPFPFSSQRERQTDRQTEPSSSEAFTSAFTVEGQFLVQSGSTFFYT